MMESIGSAAIVFDLYEPNRIVTITPNGIRAMSRTAYLDRIGGTKGAVAMRKAGRVLDAARVRWDRGEPWFRLADNGIGQNELTIGPRFAMLYLATMGGSDNLHATFDRIFVDRKEADQAAGATVQIVQRLDLGTVEHVAR